MSTKHVTCRYFLHGVCREGNNCLFSHDPNRSSPSTVCKFYQRGVCAYGERCRYDHIKVSFRGGGAPGEPAYRGGAPGEPAYRGGATGEPAYRGGATGEPAYRGGATGEPAYRGGATGEPAYRGGATGEPAYRGGATGEPAYRGGATGEPAYRGGATGEPAHRGGATGEPAYRGGATEEPAYGSRATEELAYRGGATGRGGRGGAKKPLVLRDMDGACGGAVDAARSKVIPPQSYVDAMRAGLPMTDPGTEVGGACSALLCPYAAAGHCYYGDACTYLHGDLCEVCGLQVLHPTDAEQRRAHEKECMQEFEADMERAFAAQLSQDKVCSVCMEVVVMKSSRSERRFGILSSCCHVFCLSCIRQWRVTKSFSNNIIKSCPECRVASEFVIPSVYWVEDQNEKNRLIDLFKTGVSKKPCKYFDSGRGSCPFGGHCLYLHTLPDGTKVEAQPMRKQQSSEGGVRVMNSVRLWDFIEERQQRSVPPPDDDIMELRELFLQMSGPSQDEAPPTNQQ